MKMIGKRTFTWMNIQKERSTFLCKDFQVDLFTKTSTTFSLKLCHPQTTKYLKEISGKIICAEFFKVQMNNWQE